MHLTRRGWSISALARHIGRDRKTVRAYLRGERQPAVRRRSAPDPLEPFMPYLAARFGDDPRLSLTALLDELVPLRWTGSYQTLATYNEWENNPLALFGFLTKREFRRHYNYQTVPGLSGRIVLGRLPIEVTAGWGGPESVE